MNFQKSKEIMIQICPLNWPEFIEFEQVVSPIMTKIYQQSMPEGGGGMPAEMPPGMPPGMAEAMAGGMSSQPEEDNIKIEHKIIIPPNISWYSAKWWAIFRNIWWGRSEEFHYIHHSLWWICIASLQT